MRRLNQITVLSILALAAACSNRARPEQANDAASEGPHPASEPAEPVPPAPAEPVAPAQAEAHDAGPAEAGDAAPVEAGDAAAAPQAPYDVSGWDTILRTYVTEDGGFRYEALRSNAEHRALLEEFVQTIDAARPDGWPRDEQLAFYINAYNALVIDSVLDLWPVESVMRERGFFRARRHGVAGNQITLDQLENEIIRSDRFSERRIHFVVNCASAGCPPLAPYALTAANLEETLASSARAFVRRTTRFNRARRHILVSQLFEWFAGDFGGPAGVKAFIADQLEGEDAEFVRARTTAIGHFNYDWTLNGRP